MLRCHQYRPFYPRLACMNPVLDVKTRVSLSLDQLHQRLYTWPDLAVLIEKKLQQNLRMD